MTQPKKQKTQKHIRHTVYYKNEDEKKLVEKYAEEKDMTVSKVIYRLLKKANIIQQ